jgi:3-hydroxyacyl-CoA dehydrogenase
MSRIAIVGAGLVGRGWAIVFAQAGHDVAVFDASEDIRASVPRDVRASLRDMAAAGLLREPAEAIAARIVLRSSLAEALAECDYVQESVFERLDVKTAVSAEIAALLPRHAVVGSSSSGIPASQFTAALAPRDRFLVVHPVNPPHLVPVVELVPAPWTSSETLAQARALMERVGQSVVTVNREIDGFVLNRLQGALLNEAWALFEAGYASAEDIDRTVRDGLGLRWAFMGPFETIDLNAPGGVADYAGRLGPLYHRIAQQRTAPQPWSDELIAAVEAERRTHLPREKLAARGAWRDRRLMGLVAHRRRAAATDQQKDD